MTEQSLNLLDRHSFVDGTCCQGAPELMRVHAVHSELFTQFPKSALYSADTESAMRFTQRNEQGGGAVSSGCNVVPKMDFRSCIKVDWSLLVTFAKNNAFTTLKVYVSYIKLD